MANIIGTTAEDILTGTSGSDTFDGLESGDTFVIGATSGYDIFADSGTTGIDRIVAQAKGVIIRLASGFGPASGIEEISANGFARVSIVAGNGNDVLDFSATVLTGIIAILTGSGSDSVIGSAGADAIRGNNSSDQLWGGAGDDALYGGDLNDLDPVRDAWHGADGNDYLDGGQGNDLLAGGANNDILLGGAGRDTLVGGSGADDFAFSSESDSLPGTERDQITDFAVGADDIVLTAIDADATLEGDQAFSLDSDGGFSTGEIRQTVTAGGLLLELNTDADPEADMAILVANVTNPLAATDFEL
jgi:Ca2+-binding RTX toxin-like protein